MHRCARTVGSSLCAALLVAGCTNEPAPSTTRPTGPAGPPFEALVTAVQDRVDVYDGIATGVIALVRRGEESRVVTGGLSEVEGKQPMAPGQRFPVASITKPMVATLVLQLVEEGRLALGEDVRALIPQLAGLDRKITVEQLLSHRSGLVSDLDLADLRRIGLGATAALVEAGARQGFIFRPGTRGSYSNLGYGALGLVVEKVLDEPLGDALEERVFGPASMTEASLGGEPDVQGYADGHPVRSYYLDYLPAAGSVVATAGDVDRFFRALWAGDLLPAEAVDSMRTPRGEVQMDRSFFLDYGLGLMVREVGCGTTVGHSGRIAGFTLEAWTLEGSERSVVVAVNDELADDVARGIVETALCEG